MSREIRSGKERVVCGGKRRGKSVWKWKDNRNDMLKRTEKMKDRLKEEKEVRSDKRG